MNNDKEDSAVKKRIAILVSFIALCFVPAAHALTASQKAVNRVFGHNRNAHCVALHESHYEAGAISPTEDYGLYQINWSWLGKVITFVSPRHGHRIYRMYVQRRYILRPFYNARVAFILSRGGRTWGPWVAYQKGYCS